jgi:peptidoglycan hydrolase CwlO-like protein
MKFEFADVEDLLYELDACKQRHETLLCNYQSLDDKYCDLLDDNGGLQGDLEYHRERAEEWEELYDEAKDEIEHLKKEIEELTQQLEAINENDI